MIINFLRMRRKALLFFLLLPFLKSWSQNPATIFTIANHTINLPCGTNCTSISATVPHIKQTDNYIVTSMQYLPFAYQSTAGADVLPLTGQSFFDDRWTSSIATTFPFCFYGQTYSNLLIGTNSAITFDLSRAQQGSGYTITTGTPIPNTAYAPSMIFGPYHDVDIDDATSSTNSSIRYRIEGTAPTRRFIVTYNNVPYFGSSCGSYFATHEMVLYESTGVIEVYIKDKPSCSGWNSGLAILGIQNQARNSAVAAPGKNATVWGSTNMNEAYRFTPYAGTPKFKRAELVLNGAVVATGDTSTASPGNLNLNFPNVCPTQDSTAYILRVVYASCSNASGEVSFQDTVYVKKTTPTVTLSKVDATCATGGTITANVSTSGTYQYSLNGGAAQSSNVFSNLTAGNYTVTVSASGCSATATTSISLNNTLTLAVGPVDTAVCAGASFTPRVTSAATSYTWSPSAGLSASNIAQPVITAGNQNQSYTVTATQGLCQRTGTINVTVFPGAVANAGPDQNIIAGDQIQLQASGSTGTYLWTPPTGLSATNVLQPVASPTTTTTYTLKVTSASGCTASDNVTVNVIPYCVKVMEAFTPNGDGINDLWLVTNGNCLKSAKAEVFNRYGNKVFESQDYKNNWNGTYNGKPLPDGTYYYVITYQLINGKLVYLRGNVTILR